MPALKIRRVLATCATALLLNAWAARAQGDAPLKLLPLKRVRLYEVGVGYFERSGVLRDKSDLGLSLPQSQLDDALTSLVILGGSGQARIADIELESRESPDLARAEAALTIGTVGHGSGTSASPLLDVGNLTALSGAAGVEGCGALPVQGRERDRPRRSRFGLGSVRRRNVAAHARHVVRR
ncbi:MAG TPA: hypothetical protein VGF76_25640 [Polyangiaceae bacterium]|jgi:hypothetical protein